MGTACLIVFISTIVLQVMAYVLEMIIALKWFRDSYHTVCVPYMFVISCRIALAIYILGLEWPRERPHDPFGELPIEGKSSRLCDLRI